MSKEQRQKIIRKDDIPYLLSWMLLILSYLLTVVFVAKRITYLLDADMSSELLLAEVLSRGNGIITTKWCYSSEIRILYIQIFTSFLFRFMSSWHNIRVISTAFHIALMLFSYYCLCKSLKIERAFPITASVLALPISYEFVNYYLLGLYYLPFITVFFFSLALLFDYLEKGGSRDRKQLIKEIAAYVIAFLSGLGGYRLILLFFLPLFLVLVFPALKDFLNGREEQANIKRVRFGIISFISALMGLVFYVFVLTKIITVQKFDHFFFFPFDNDTLLFNVNAIIKNMGYTPGPLMLSGILKNLGFGAVTLLTGFSLFHIPKDKEGDDSRILSMLFMVSLSLFLLVQIFVMKDTVERYISPIIILLVPLCTNNICKAEYKRKKFITIAAVLLVILKMAGEVTFYYDYKDLDETKPYRDVVSYLKANDVSCGYSTFWNANIITELSDGDINMYHWEAPELMDVSDPATLRPWLQEKSHFEAFPEGKVAVILSEDERPYSILSHGIGQKVPDLVADNIYVYVFESHDEILDLMADYDLDYFYDGVYLVDGYDLDGSRYLYEDGYSYGPMITLPRGSYRLTIRGEGLSDISFIPTAGKGAYVSDAMEVQKDNDIAVYEFCFDEYSEQVEFVIINEGSGEVRLDSVDLAITAR
ncbi:MAG: hypothetical protein II718_08225 [Clostridiales bacterium]|nr:hypothetical protein [Clostridiales bacterium]